MSASTGKKSIKTIVCGDVALPVDIKRAQPWPPKENRTSNSTSTLSTSSFKRGFGRGPRGKKLSKEDEEFLAKKEELRTYMSNIKEFNAHSQLGQSRRQFQEDRLTQLGALPVKQAKMPFKVRLRIEKAQKKRETRKLTELKESDEVVAVSVTKKRKTNGEVIDKKKKKKVKRY